MTEGGIPRSTSNPNLIDFFWHVSSDCDMVVPITALKESILGAKNLEVGLNGRDEVIYEPMKVGVSPTLFCALFEYPLFE